VALPMSQRTIRLLFDLPYIHTCGRLKKEVLYVICTALGLATRQILKYIYLLHYS